MTSRKFGTRDSYGLVVERLDERLLFAAFEAVSDLPVGSIPQGVVVSDFNRDGRPDLATANASGNSVSVLLGTTTGTFSSAANFAVGSGPARIIVKDFNKDGKPDLATANNGSGDVSILLGTGTGTFSTAISVGLIFGLEGLASEDFNGDGKLDLATTQNGGVDVRVRLGNGDGTFGGFTRVTCGVSPTAIATADINGDGKSDLLTANYSDKTFCIALGNGNGTFGSVISLPVSSQPLRIIASDSNSDGKVDLIGTTAAGTVVSFLNNGNSTFSAAQSIDVGLYPWDLVANEFNGDGNPDLAVAAGSDGVASVLLGTGNGSYSVVQKVSFFAAGKVAAADFDLDGKVDLAVANTATVGLVRVLQNRMPRYSLNPELEVESVSTAVTTVPADRTLPVKLTIRNTGGRDSPATLARLRLSTDRTLTRYDLPLSPLDVPVPAIAGGGSYTGTFTVTVPPGTPPGGYYVGAFVDPNNTAGQSDVTNDAGISTTPVTLLPQGQLPVITRQPQAVTVDAGQAIEMSVDVTLPGVSRQSRAARLSELAYRWFRDGRPILEATGPVLRVTRATADIAGEITVVVSNPAGYVMSNVAPVMVRELVSPLTRPADDGKLIAINGRAIDPNKPTVILTHGWNDERPFPWNTSGPFDLERSRLWLADAQSRIDQRLGVGMANVLAFVWSGAYTGDASPSESERYRILAAASRTGKAGAVLASAIRDKLGSSYAKPLHLIGHSLGTIVNSAAMWNLKRVGWNNGAAPTQMTLLDPPLRARSLGGASGVLRIYTESEFHRLIPTDVDWIDNYWGNSGNATGEPVENAFNVSYPNSDHSDVRVRYVDTIAADSAASGGFDYSCLLGNGTWVHPGPTIWRPQMGVLPPSSTPPTTLGNSSDPGWLQNAGTVRSGTGLFYGQMTPTLNLSAVGGGLRPMSAAAAGYMTTATLDVKLSDAATDLTFDVAIDQPAGGQSLVVSFNGTPISEVPLPADLTPGQAIQMSVPIALLAGDAGTLRIDLRSSTATTATFANFQAFDRPDVLLPAWLAPSAGAAYTLVGSTLNVTAGTVTLTADAASTMAGLSLNVSGTARVVLQSSQHLAALSIQDAAGVVLDAGGGKVLRVAALDVANTASLDLNNNSLIYDYATAAGQTAVMRQLIVSGRGGGTWTGTGLTSTVARNQPGNPTTLGYMDAAAYKAIHGNDALFAGEAIDDTAVLVKYVLVGDADFNARVNFADFVRLQSGFGTKNTTTAGGDFDGDGDTDFADFVLLQTNFGQTL